MISFVKTTIMEESFPLNLFFDFKKRFTHIGKINIKHIDENIIKDKAISQNSVHTTHIRYLLLDFVAFPIEQLWRKPLHSLDEILAVRYSITLKIVHMKYLLVKLIGVYLVQIRPMKKPVPINNFDFQLANFMKIFNVKFKCIAGIHTVTHSIRKHSYISSSIKYF